jgi:hypothetical protein
VRTPDRLETPRVIGKPAPFVRAFVEAMDDAIREQHPSHTMAATPRAWLAFCVTAVLLTNSLCGARFARASRGTDALAALSWMLRQSTMPWDPLLGARGRGILPHPGLTSGPLVIDATAKPRAKAAKALAYLYKLRDQARGGYLWGPSLVLRVLGTSTISRPVGVVFSPPAPELSAWDRTAKALKKPGGPTPQRPRKPAPTPQYPTTAQRARRLLATVQAHQPAGRMHAVLAEALEGTATCVEGASALLRGVPGLSQRRSHQNMRGGKRAQHVADDFATPPGTPSSIRIRGGEAVVAMVGSARW